MNSPEFIEKSKEYIVRGDVVWVEFGFNIGEEFSGRHPAVGNIKGVDLDTISKAFLDSDLFKYRPSKNN